jgi:hypothetical protein
MITVVSKKTELVEEEEHDIVLSDDNSEQNDELDFF